MSKTASPLVGVIMGSRSDYQTLEAAIEILRELQVPHEKRIVSAHRTPDWMFEYASTAEKRGLQVIDRTIMPDELGTFSECFLVGTAAEVTPVSEIGPHTYKPGKICEMLINDYSAAVQPRKVAAE